MKVARLAIFLTSGLASVGGLLIRFAMLPHALTCIYVLFTKIKAYYAYGLSVNFFGDIFSFQRPAHPAGNWITIIQLERCNEELVGVTMTQSVTESILLSRESFHQVVVLIQIIFVCQFLLQQLRFI